MFDQTTAITVNNSEVRSIDIGTDYLLVTDKENNSVKITGLNPILWLDDMRYFVASFEWRNMSKDPDILNKLERLQDTVADTLQKIRPNVNTEASA